MKILLSKLKKITLKILRTRRLFSGTIGGGSGGSGGSNGCGGNCAVRSTVRSRVFREIAELYATTTFLAWLCASLAKSQM